jgi:hypothetical protein
MFPPPICTRRKEKGKKKKRHNENILPHKNFIFNEVEEEY